MLQGQQKGVPALKDHIRMRPTFRERRALRALARAAASSSPASWLSLRTCCSSSRVCGMSVPIIQRRQRILPRCRYLRQPQHIQAGDCRAGRLEPSCVRVSGKCNFFARPFLACGPQVIAYWEEVEEGLSMQIPHSVGSMGLTRRDLHCQSPSA